MPQSDRRSELKEKLRLAEVIPAEIRWDLEEEWRRHAGPLYEKMLLSHDVAEALLSHNDRNLRVAALGVLTYIWRPKPGDQCATRLEKMALEDPDIVVRAAALCALGACHRASSDRRVSRLMVEILVNESEHVAVRRCAYQSLFSLEGRMMPSWPGLFASPQTMLRIPEDIDWGFVRSFLSGSEKAPGTISTNDFM